MLGYTLSISCAFDDAGSFFPLFMLLGFHPLISAPHVPFHCIIVTDIVQ